MSKTINSDLIRGNINTIILKALYEGDRYGYDIIKEIEEKSHGQYILKQPTLYSCLKRLESQGFITAYWGEQSNGGRRKYYSLTDMGREVFVRSQDEYEYSRTIIDQLISERDYDLDSLERPGGLEGYDFTEQFAGESAGGEDNSAHGDVAKSTADNTATETHDNAPAESETENENADYAADYRADKESENADYAAKDETDESAALPAEADFDPTETEEEFGAYKSDDDYAEEVAVSETPVEETGSNAFGEPTEAETDGIYAPEDEAQPRADETIFYSSPYEQSQKEDEPDVLPQKEDEPDILPQKEDEDDEPPQEAADELDEEEENYKAIFDSYFENEPYPAYEQRPEAENNQVAPEPTPEPTPEPAPEAPAPAAAQPGADTASLIDELLGGGDEMSYSENIRTEKPAPIESGRGGIVFDDGDDSYFSDNAESYRGAQEQYGFPLDDADDADTALTEPPERRYAPAADEARESEPKYTSDFIGYDTPLPYDPGSAAKPKRGDDYRSVLSSLVDDFDNRTAPPPVKKEDAAVEEPNLSVREQIQVRNFGKLSQSIRDLGENVKIRTPDSAAAREFNKQYYFYKNKLQLLHYGILFVIMLLESFITYIGIKNSAVPPQQFGTPVYVCSILLALAFPIASIIMYLLDPGKRKRMDFNMKNSMIFRTIIMCQLILIVYALNVYAGMPISGSGEYLLSMILPCVLATNVPVSAIVFYALYRSKKFAIEN